MPHVRHAPAASERIVVKSTTKTYSMPPEVAEAAKAKAVELGVAESTIARWALERFLNLRTVDVTIARQPPQRGKRGKKA